MKEYKLSAKSKYSVCYLLCGLFMFFFMFAILNLSSYASSFNSSSVSVPVNESYSETYGIIDYNYDLDDYSFPVTTITTHSSGSGWSRSSSSNTCRGSNTIHLVTSEGDFVVNVSQGVADGSNTNHTVTVLGVPERVYSEFEVFNNSSASKSVYAYTYVDSISVTDFGNSGSPSNFSDYSSYSPFNILTDVNTSSSYGSKTFSSGSVSMFSFKDINTNDLTFTPSNIMVPLGKGSNKVLFTFSFSCTSSSDPLNSVRLVYYLDGVSRYLDKSKFTVTLYNNSAPIYRYMCSAVLDLNEVNDFGVLFFVLTGFTNTNMSDFTFSALSYKATIADYMDYVKKNYNDIAPSVSDLNQNTAQSVSDIGTAQTFETSAFTNFDTQLNSSGLDTFSLSFASTPLLWVSGIITTFYNNMPSTFQYLLMFVAFVGILVIIFNISGRVIRRFGGGD